MSVSIKNDGSIGSCNREAENDRSTLLTKDKTERKIVTSLEGIGGAGTVCRCTAADGFGVVVGQTVSPDCVVSKVQVGDVVDLGCGKGVFAIHLGKNVSTMVKDKVAGRNDLTGAVKVDIRTCGFVDSANLGGSTAVVRSVVPVVSWIQACGDVVVPRFVGVVCELNSLVATNRRFRARYNRGCRCGWDGCGYSRSLGGSNTRVRGDHRDICRTDINGRGGCGNAKAFACT